MLKQLREGGHLSNRNPPNTIQVRVREAKSQSEKERYTLENCSVDAKFIREKAREDVRVNDGGEGDGSDDINGSLIENALMKDITSLRSVDSESESDSDEDVPYSNPFSALM